MIHDKTILFGTLMFYKQWSAAVSSGFLLINPLDFDVELR